MNVLILSVTAGQGHHQTGLAISNYLEKNGHTSYQLDCYEYLSPLIKEMISSGYLMSTKYSPALYGRFYRLAEKLDEFENTNLLSMITNSIFYRKMLNFIEDFKPDIIICTHVFASVLLSHIRKKGLTTTSIGIITDFTIHPYWGFSNLNYYVIANEYLIPAIINKGIPKEKVLPVGIPIFEKFSKKIDKKLARVALSIQDINTILIMGGSMGFGNILKTIQKIDKNKLNFQIITVCGNNDRLKHTIDNLETQHKIYNYSYVSNVDVLMDASDCIITKPGGLTTSEALAKELPMLISKPIPGQEDRNLDFILNFGCGMKISKTTPIDELISQFFVNDVKKDIMINNIKLIKKQNSVQDLYHHMIKILENNA
jgi:processive 1,2-diacylglycerol beta-glucosyltransferase